MKTRRIWWSVFLGVVFGGIHVLSVANAQTTVQLQSTVQPPAKVHPGAISTGDTSPDGGRVGQLIIDDGNRLFFWTGTDWQPIALDPQMVRSLLQSELGMVTPQAYGAIPGDGLCDAAAFNLMFAQLANQALTVRIPPGVYDVCQSIELPSATPAPYLRISGYGAVLQANGDFELLRRMPADQASAGLMINDHILVIEGLYLKGADQGVGMRIGSTYSMEIKNCHFVGFDTGLISEFSLNGRYTGLRFTNCFAKSFVGRHGSWPGANTANAAFNANRISDCRVFGRSGQISHFELIGADLNILENCISEGTSPQHNIFVDSFESSNVNHALTARNIWIESQGDATNPGSNYFTFENYRGYATLENVQAFPGIQPNDRLINYVSQMSEGNLIRISGYRGYTNLINNMNGDIYGPYYIIEDSEAMPVTAENSKWLNGDNWVNGVVPRKLNIEVRRSQNTGQTTISRWDTERENRSGN